MAWYSNLSKEHRELVEDACAIYMAHHHPGIADSVNQLIFGWMKAKGESEDTVRDIEKHLWEETALEKLSPALGVTVLERGVVVRRKGVVVTLSKSDKHGFDCRIECDEGTSE